ncbi:hypothetical protein DIPPA_01924 [Diplonema papillatum]|nr:hypothetical protein DIPPA_01924 [Diplonema papillatum]
MSVFTPLVIGSPTVRTASLSPRFAPHAALVAEHTSSLSPRFVQPGSPLAHARAASGSPRYHLLPHPAFGDGFLPGTEHHYAAALAVEAVVASSPRGFPGSPARLAADAVLAASPRHLARGNSPAQIAASANVAAANASPATCGAAARAGVFANATAAAGARRLAVEHQVNADRIARASMSPRASPLLPAGSLLPGSPRCIM